MEVVSYSEIVHQRKNDRERREQPEILASLASNGNQSRKSHPQQKADVQEFHFEKPRALAHEPRHRMCEFKPEMHHTLTSPAHVSARVCADPGDRFALLSVRVCVFAE